MRKYSALVILIFSVLFIIAGYFVYTGYLRPLYDNNVSQTETINLSQKKELIFHKRDEQNKIFNVEIEINGNTRSNFGLNILDGNKSVHSARIKGGSEVEFTYVNDWYSDSIVLLFEPEAFEEGTLEVECRFLSL